MSGRFSFDDLVRFAAALLARVGLESEKADTVARLLATADAMGHTTHGLAQLADYLNEIESGAMRTHGSPRVLADNGAAVVWDGDRLPGVWLTAEAVKLACDRADGHGIASIAIRRSHHIGCLAVFLPAATDRGMMAIIASSDPSAAMVAPHGGRNGVFTPNPIAVGIPTDSDPILIDMSSSITTAAMSARLRQEGKRFPGAWAVDADGCASDDPNVMTTEAGGALLPAGGLDHGQKGYGLALLVEALTQGLAGYGRADGETGWGASVCVQVINPRLFGGLREFERQTGFVANACRGTAPSNPGKPVRLPGESALKGIALAKREGVELYPGILDSLARYARKFDVKPPQDVTP